MLTYYQQKNKFLRRNKGDESYRQYLFWKEEVGLLRYSDNFFNCYEFKSRDFTEMWHEFSYYQKRRYIRDGRLISDRQLKNLFDLIGWDDTPYSDFINKIKYNK